MCDYLVSNQSAVGDVIVLSSICKGMFHYLVNQSDLGDVIVGLLSSIYKGMFHYLVNQSM